jgi:hypothetical protein
VGLFRRDKDAGVAAGSGATALVTASRFGKHLEHETGVATNVSEESNELWALGRGTIPNILTLQVTAPSTAPFETEGAYRVPAKATASGNVLPPGIEVPVVVDPATREVQIDWDAFFARSGWKGEVKRAKAQQQAAHERERFEADTGTKDATWEAARQAVPVWLGAVRAGQMTRAAVEEELDGFLARGHMDPADAAELRRQMDADGL